MNKKIEEIYVWIDNDIFYELTPFFRSNSTIFTGYQTHTKKFADILNMQESDRIIFKSLLKEFVEDRIYAYSLDDKNQVSFSFGKDELFTLLSALNFKKQEDHFKNLVEHRKLSVFVIRGEGKCGQKWLLHQLIDVFPEKGEHSVNVFELDIHPTFDDFLENIRKCFKLSFSTSRTKTNASRIVDYLLLQAKNAHQFLVFKKSYSFIHSSAFKEFYDYLLDGLHIGLVNNVNLKKVVIFFVEDTTSPYNIDELGCECHFFEDGNRINQLDFTAKWKDSHDNLKIAGLYSIEKFDLSLMNNWLSTVTHTEILEHFCDTDSVEKMLCDCDNGNPHEIIKTISLKLNYTWQKY